MVLERSRTRGPEPEFGGGCREAFDAYVDLNPTPARRRCGDVNGYDRLLFPVT